MIGGIPCDVIRIENQRGEAGVTVYIDRETHRPKRVSLRLDQPGQKMTYVTTIISEKLNAPIPDSVFRLIPPTGSKELALGDTGNVGDFFAGYVDRLTSELKRSP